MLYSQTSRELSARRFSKWSGLRDRVQPIGGVSPTKRSLILLVHGFNVDETEARESFDAFVRHLRDRNLPPVELEKIWKFYWPGNLRLKILSSMSYPWQIGVSLESAARLDSFLQELSSRIGTGAELTVVAHSLGCRLSLDLLRRIATSPNTGYCAKFTIFLMAAAVPVGMMWAGNPIGDTLWRATERRCLHSTSDSVLKRWFRVGQTVAGEGMFPHAVGFRGEPPMIWTGLPLNTYLEHGEYWSSEATAREFMKSLGYSVEHDTPRRGILR